MTDLWNRTNVTSYINTHCREQEIRRVFEGYMARVLGVEPKDSPYWKQQSGMKFESWIKGWEMAEEDINGPLGDPK